MFNTFSLENQTNLVNVWSRLQIKDLSFSNLDQLLTLFQVKGLTIQLLYCRLKNSFQLRYSELSWVQIIDQVLIRTDLLLDLRGENEEWWNDEKQSSQMQPHSLFTGVPTFPASETKPTVSSLLFFFREISSQSFLVKVLSIPLWFIGTASKPGLKNLNWSIEPVLKTTRTVHLKTIKGKMFTLNTSGSSKKKSGGYDNHATSLRIWKTTTRTRDQKHVKALQELLY